MLLTENNKIKYILAIISLMYSSSNYAYSVNNNLTTKLKLSHGLQCMEVNASMPSATYDDDSTLDSYNSACRGAVPIRLGTTFDLTQNQRIYASLGYAVGNGLDEIGLLSVSPWDVSLENSSKNINGSQRDFLRQAWYEYSFNIFNHAKAAFTIGLIDSADFIDINEYANDEFTQFMAGSFVNSNILSPPSNDAGVGFSINTCNFSVNLVGMSVGGKDNKPNYKFWGSEISYQFNHHVGNGNYRIIFSSTSKDFTNIEETALHKLSTLGFSFDQAIYDLGLFARVSWQKPNAAIDYQSLYSFGFECSGKTWSRQHDKIALAYAYLKEGNRDLQNNRIIEAYYKAMLNKCVSFTVDIQHHRDRRTPQDPYQRDPIAWVFSTRITAQI